MKHAKKRGKIFCIVGLLIVAAVAAYAVSVYYLGDNPDKYAKKPPGVGIDFSDPDIAPHTAEDGIAVVSPASPSARPAHSISDPDEIWREDISPTHGGFTLPVKMDNGSIGVVTIPGIDLSARVFEAETEMEAMEWGVAHFRSTSAWQGNIALSAHNVNLNGTPGYFLNLHKLNQGDVISYETALGTREYIVEAIKEISELDWSMLDRTDDNRITLITCITGKPEMRLMVQGIERHP